ncbi:hypothetical protein J6590_046499 [Homalodisca vitripennis]|nr:hypothetical protein J6590_046499 [Homalodisca vitripennis]
MALYGAVCYQVFRIPCRFTPASVKKKFFHLSSSVLRYEPEIRFNTGIKHVNKLRLRDRVSEKYELIYKAPFELSFRIAYPLVLSVTIGAPACVLYLYSKEGKLELSQEFNNITFLNPSFELWFFLAVSCVFATLIFSILFKFPFRVYKHKAKQEYIAMFLSAVPPMLRQFHFKSATKSKFKNPIYLMMEDHQYYLDKKRGFLLAHYFRVPADFFEMMGEEKHKYTRD